VRQVTTEREAFQRQPAQLRADYEAAATRAVACFDAVLERAAAGSGVEWWIPATPDAAPEDARLR
jgi:hypothetical protein